jgi:hypothetical protein
VRDQGFVNMKRGFNKEEILEIIFEEKKFDKD